LDLCYLEDREAAVDANVVVAEPDRFVEFQGTGERGTFSRGELDRLLDLALVGTAQVFAAQRAVLAR
jgi:ribonuclease PH